jgi:hypothetical protein
MSQGYGVPGEAGDRSEVPFWRFLGATLDLKQKLEQFKSYDNQFRLH